jgi:hypothetical protein
MGQSSFGNADAPGTNPPFGATVFFNVPSSYNGKTPVTLSFEDARGQPIRSFSLHLKSSRDRPDEHAGDRWAPTQLRLQAERRLTAMGPGMNRFQWDLRYPPATEVNGFNPPIAAGGLPDEVDGPLVVPGTYSVVLDYGGRTARKTFAVALDPRLHPSAGALAERLALQLRIHNALDTLDRMLNEAIATRDQLNGAVAKHRLSKAQAGSAIAGLDANIGQLVQLNILASEGSLLHETKLRSHLAYLAADIDLAYDRPTAAHMAVFEELNRQAQEGEQKLQAAIAEAKRLL